MHIALLPLLTFLAVAMGVIAAFSMLSDIFSRDSRRVQERLDVAFQDKQRDKVKKSLLFKASDSNRAALLEGGQPIRQNWREWLQVMLDQSGMELTMKRLLIYCGCTSAACGLLIALPMHSLIFGLVGAVLGAPCPIGYVLFKRNARQERLRRQVSDAFDLMARVLRAGQSMQQAMQAVAAEFALPISEEFAYCAEQQNLGLAAEISMRDLAKRTGLIEMNIFVVAVLVQRQVGGNLSEILEKLALVVRQRYKTRGMIRTLTAEGRMQASVLMSLPPLLLVAMLIANYDYAIVLIQKPFLIGGMALCMALGGLWIHKIVNFDF
jgi:tight adherence protein B